MNEKEAPLQLLEYQMVRVAEQIFQTKFTPKKSA